MQRCAVVGGKSYQACCSPDSHKPFLNPYTIKRSNQVGRRKERIMASESWRILGFPSCPLEKTLQSIMEINPVYVSNLDTTGNRNPTRRDTINHNRRGLCREGLLSSSLQSELPVHHYYNWFQ